MRLPATNVMDGAYTDYRRASPEMIRVSQQHILRPYRSGHMQLKAIASVSAVCRHGVFVYSCQPLFRCSRATNLTFTCRDTILATSESAAILRHDAGRTAWRQVYLLRRCMPARSKSAIFIRPGRAEVYSDFAEATRSQRAIRQLYSPSRSEPGSVSRAVCCNGNRLCRRPEKI